MDTLEEKRQLIQTLLVEQTHIPFSRGDIHFKTVFDCQQDCYLLMLVGREDGRRVHGCLIHVDIINDKFSIRWLIVHWIA